MKPKAIEVSPTAYNFIQKFNEWLEASSKVGYRFSEEEQMYLEQMVRMLNNQIDMLIEYELKNKK